MARLFRDVVITEKLDGTNAQIKIIKPEVDVSNFQEFTANVNGHLIWAGSRNRWITPESDNYGFAGWVRRNAEELVKLGPGQHFGEWWGSGIQRAYGLKNGDKRFSLFNTIRWCMHNEEPKQIITGNPLVEKWQERAPTCCHIVPVLWEGMMDTRSVDVVLADLENEGSKAAPGFMDPEGIVIYHRASDKCFKVTVKNDESPKSMA